jgi:protein TonB
MKEEAGANTKAPSNQAPSNQVPSNQEPMNLDEYFDRARRAEPPLSKDDVSSILSEKVAKRYADSHTSNDAHRRLRGGNWRGFGRMFSHFSPKISPKGWIMLSMLTGTVMVALMLLSPNNHKNNIAQITSVDESFKPNTFKSDAHPKKRQTNDQSTKQLPSSNQVPSNQTPSNQTSKPDTTNLPAPYDFVEIDTEPFIDLSALLKKVKYPESARKLGLEGQVVVRVLVLADGAVSPRSFVEYSDGKLFDSAALSAAQTTAWKPATRAGKNVPCWVSLPIKYRNPERVGTKSVKNAEMLSLSAEELKKIGVMRDTADILTIYGWNKMVQNLYQMKVSISSAITPKLMPDSIFKQYIHNLRKQGNDALADRWELAQWENGKRALRSVLDDSADNVSKVQKVGIANVVSAREKERERIEQVRHFIFPRLVTDGHNFRYSIDVSDSPLMQRQRAISNEIALFRQRAKSRSMSQEEINDSIRSINQRFYNDLLFKYVDMRRDSTHPNGLFFTIREREEALEQQFAHEKTDVSKLIGIRVPSAIKHTDGDEYLLWYEPTPEFIALLPERYRLGLEKELAVSEKYATKCEIPTEEERKAVAGYFDSWRSCDGVLKIANVFPNPASVQATVHFTLQEARSITITVHNLNGERLAILEPTPLLGIGDHELPLDFTGRNVGVYLLALTTDKGETAIKRVMIMR